jgi:hypothetical protein
VSTRSRSQDLTADLLHDIADDEVVPVVTAPPATTRAAAVESETTAPTAFAETSLFLAPRTWLRPGIARSGTSVSLSAGPLRLRVGRR